MIKKKKKTKTYKGIGETFRINNSVATGPGIKVYGNGNTVSGPGVKVFGNKNKVSGPGVKVTGNRNTVDGVGAKAWGKKNKVTGLNCKSYKTNGAIIMPKRKIDENIKLSVTVSKDGVTTVKNNKGTIIIDKDVEFEDLGEGTIKLGEIKISANGDGDGFRMICSGMNCVISGSHKGNGLHITTKNGITHVKKASDTELSFSSIFQNSNCSIGEIYQS